MMAGLRVPLLVGMLLIVKSFSTVAQSCEDTCTTRCAFENELASDFTSLATDVANNVENISDLEKQMKPDVYFHALNVENMSPDVGDTLVFVNVKRDSFTAYDKQAGTFTAPVEGLYWFAAYICNNSNQWLLFHIMVNDEKMTDALAYDTYPNCNSANMVTKLNPGDNVSVFVGDKYGNQVIFENQHRACMFTGALIN